VYIQPELQGTFNLHPNLLLPPFCSSQVVTQKLAEREDRIFKFRCSPFSPFLFWSGLTLTLLFLCSLFLFFLGRDAEAWRARAALHRSDDAALPAGAPFYNIDRYLCGWEGRGKGDWPTPSTYQMIINPSYNLWSAKSFGYPPLPCAHARARAHTHTYVHT